VTGWLDPSGSYLAISDHLSREGRGSHHYVEAATWREVGAVLRPSLRGPNTHSMLMISIYHSSPNPLKADHAHTVQKALDHLGPWNGASQSNANVASSVQIPIKLCTNPNSFWLAPPSPPYSTLSPSLSVLLLIKPSPLVHMSTLFAQSFFHA